MTEVIDFGKEKMNREVAPDCRLVMPDGSEWYKFTADYRFPEGSCVGGGTFGVTLWARNQAEAEERVRAIKETLGDPVQIYEEIPA
jgi:hypothetical protein